MAQNLKKMLSLVAILFLMFAAAGLAAEYEQLTPLLHDLKGWQADAAHGMTMDMGGTKMINAAREYQKGAGKITAMVMVGNQAMAQGSMQAMKTETDKGKVSLSTIDGFKVQSYYDKVQKSGMVMIFLSQGQGAMFTLAYEGLSEKAGLKMARQFNWKKMKAAVEKLL